MLSTSWNDSHKVVTMHFESDALRFVLIVGNFQCLVIKLFQLKFKESRDISNKLQVWWKLLGYKEGFEV